MRGQEPKNVSVSLPLGAARVQICQYSFEHPTHLYNRMLKDVGGKKWGHVPAHFIFIATLISSYSTDRMSRPTERSYGTINTPAVSNSKHRCVLKSQIPLGDEKRRKKKRKKERKRAEMFMPAETWPYISFQQGWRKRIFPILISCR